MLLSQVIPACLFSCTGEWRDAVPQEGTDPAPVEIRAESGRVESLDLFCFEREEPFLLDAHQRTEGAIPGRWNGVSRTGAKTVFLVANRGEDAYTWEDVRSLRNLSAVPVSLAEEDPAYPVMTASAPLTAGGTVPITLRPLLAEVRLHSLLCDFHDRPYAGARLEDVRIYLTRACDRCRLDGESIPSHVDGQRSPDLPRPEMLLSALPEGVGDETIFPNIRLYTYPNPAPEETLGTPQTRLVIEGRLLGQTWYYPIPVVPLERGKSHVFDVVLTRTGTTDPEIPATPDMVRLYAAVAPWNDMEPLIQTF